MHIRTFLKPLSFIPAILLMYMIFTFSAQPGEVSSTVSYKASCVIVKAADNVFDMGMDDYQISYYATKINGVTRKLAHMTEYFLLAIAVSFPLYVYGLHGILLLILAGGLCVAFACGDEYHQSFVAGRSPAWKDVGIDSVGILIGIILVRIVGWTGRMTIFRPIHKDGVQKLSRREKKQLAKQQKAQQKSYAQNPNGYPPYQNMPPYSGQPYANVPPYSGANPGQVTPDVPPYQGSPYQGSPYQGSPYQEPPYSGSVNQGMPPYYDENAPYSYPPQTPPQYMGQQEHSSDELSDDMPLSHLFRPKKKS